MHASSSATLSHLKLNFLMIMKPFCHRLLGTTILALVKQYKDTFSLRKACCSWQVLFTPPLLIYYLLVIYLPMVNCSPWRFSHKTNVSI